MGFMEWIPIVVVVIVAGSLWWKVQQCCHKVQQIIDWLATGDAGTLSVVEWIGKVDTALCNLEAFAADPANVPLDPAKIRCGAGGTNPTDPPQDPPPFA